MKFLADENIHSDIVGWLRSHGHDVLHAMDDLQGESDDELLALAKHQERVLITDDKDFGELVFHRRLATHGVVLLRFTSPSIVDRLRRLEAVRAMIENTSSGKYVVISDIKARVRAFL